MRERERAEVRGGERWRRRNEVGESRKKGRDRE